jgi:hypothetical protein
VKGRQISPVYFVIAVYVWLAVIGFLEFGCLANVATKIEPGKGPDGMAWAGK